MFIHHVHRVHPGWISSRPLTMTITMIMVTITAIIITMIIMFSHGLQTPLPVAGPEAMAPVESSSCLDRTSHITAERWSTKSSGS
eukprot:7260743-Pyramimonas_sp.AAC.1